MSAQKAIISALYFSLIHKSRTEVSSPPEYAKTIFIIPQTSGNLRRTPSGKSTQEPMVGPASPGNRPVTGRIFPDLQRFRQACCLGELRGATAKPEDIPGEGETGGQ